jgi:hypothetical protein
VGAMNVIDLTNPIDLMPDPRVGRAKRVLIHLLPMDASGLCEQNCKVVSISLSPSKAYEFGDKEMRLGKSTLVANTIAPERPVERVVHVSVAFVALHLNYS